MISSRISADSRGVFVLLILIYSIVLLILSSAFCEMLTALRASESHHIACVNLAAGSPAGARGRHALI
jgi:uncharacterized Tic20 family protein